MSDVLKCRESREVDMLFIIYEETFLEFVHWSVEGIEWHICTPETVKIDMVPVNFCNTAVPISVSLLNNW